MSVSLDAREVLQTLNGMGYKNISAHQLKEFIRDLKRFIIYENRYSNIEDVFQKVVNQRKTTQETVVDSNPTPTVGKRKSTTTVYTSQKTTDTRLTSAVNVASRVLRVKDQNNQTSFTDIPQPTPRDHSERLRSDEVGNRRGPIPIPPTIEPQPTPSVCSKSTATTTTSKRKTPLIRNTPTDLFLFYQKDWNRFRHLLPGENSRSSVRAEVRKRMEHQPPPKPKVYLRFEDDQKKTMTTRLGRREM